MNKSQFTFVITLSGITGIIIGLTSPAINIPYFLLFTAFLIFIIINFFIKIIHPVYLLIIFGLLFGIWRAQSYLSLLGRSNIKQIIGQSEITGTIVAPPEINNNRQKIVVGEISCRHNNNQDCPDHISGNLIASLGRYPPLAYRQIISLQGQIDPISNFDDQFSYTGFLSLKNILTAISHPQIQIIKNKPPDIFWYIYHFKDMLLKILTKNFPADHAALLAGLILGEKKILPDNIYQQFITLGLSHIIVVSGYNLTLFSQLFMQNLTGLIHRHTAFWLTVIFMVIFTIMTGAEASIVRALIMTILMISAPMLSRLPHQINAILFTAVIMIFQNPLILFYDIGFHLSFLATLGLVFISPILNHITAKIKFLPLIKNTALETLAATIATLPYSIHQFSRFSLYLLPANLVILPLTGIITLSGIAFLIFSWLPTVLKNFISLPINYLLKTILTFTALVSQLPFANLSISLGWQNMIIGYVILILIIYFFHQIKKQKNFYQ